MSSTVYCGRMALELAYVKSGRQNEFGGRVLRWVGGLVVPEIPAKRARKDGVVTGVLPVKRHLGAKRPDADTIKDDYDLERYQSEY